MLSLGFLQTEPVHSEPHQTLLTYLPNLIGASDSDKIINDEMSMETRTTAVVAMTECVHYYCAEIIAQSRTCFLHCNS